MFRGRVVLPLYFCSLGIFYNKNYLYFLKRQNVPNYLKEGGKGWPPGFTVYTSTFIYYFRTSRHYYSHKPEAFGKHSTRQSRKWTGPLGHGGEESPSLYPLPSTLPAPSQPGTRGIWANHWVWGWNWQFFFSIFFFLKHRFPSFNWYADRWHLIIPRVTN